jgi:hypothetical protein
VLYRQPDPNVVTHDASRPAAAVALALGPNAVARGARPLTPTTPRLGHAKGPLVAAPTAAGHGVTSLTLWVAAADVYFGKICGGPYIFAKS